MKRLITILFVGLIALQSHAALIVSNGTITAGSTSAILGGNLTSTNMTTVTNVL
jgi:hypothetical protein